MRGEVHYPPPPGRLPRVPGGGRRTELEPLCKAVGEEGLQLSGGRCQNKPVPSGSPETGEGTGPAQLGPGWLQVAITELRRDCLETSGLGALATCPAWGPRGKLVKTAAALTGPHMPASAVQLNWQLPEGRAFSHLQVEHEWQRDVWRSPQGQREVEPSLAWHTEVHRT